MNWPEFFRKWGEQTEQLRQLKEGQNAANKKLATLEQQLASVKSLQDQVRGAYKAAVGIGSLVGALVVIAARVVGIWQ